MVTNLPEEVKALWAKAASTRNPRVKLQLLRQVYSLIPKHKGTSKLVVSLKRQIANLEEQIRDQERKSRKKGSGGVEWIVRKTGYPQVCIVGSMGPTRALFEALTGVGAIEYRLYESPIVGVYLAGDVPFQIIWAPINGVTGWLTNRIANVILNSDLVLLVRSGPEDYREALERLDSHGITLSNKRVGADVTLTTSGGLIITGTSANVTQEEVRRHLSKLNVRNAVVKLYNDSTIEDVEAALLGRRYKKYLVVAADGCKPGDEWCVCLNEFRENPSLSCEKMLKILGLIRVYTKPPHKDVQKPPLLVSEDATIKDAVKEIREGMLKGFKYAKVYRGGRVIKVGLDFRLLDKDVLEIHA